MMRFFLFFIIFIFSLALQWFLGRWFAPLDFPLPVAIFTALAIFWRVSLQFRLWFSLAAGITLDSVSFLPFGTYSAVLLGAGFCVEILQNLFSNVESRLVEGLSIGILLASMFAVLYPLAFWLV